MLGDYILALVFIAIYLVIVIGYVSIYDEYEGISHHFRQIA